MNTWPMRHVGLEPISSREFRSILVIARRMRPFLIHNPSLNMHEQEASGKHRWLSVLHRLSCNSRAWTITLIKAFVEKYSLIISDRVASKENLTLKEVKDGKRRLCRNITWHTQEPLTHFEEDVCAVRRVAVCKNCLTLTHVRKRCTCSFDRVNARMQSNPHYDIDIDNSCMSDKLKPSPCLLMGTCMEVNCGYNIIQFYIERAIFSNSPKGARYYLLKALEVDWDHCEKWRNWNKKWNYTRSRSISLSDYTSN